MKRAFHLGMFHLGVAVLAWTALHSSISLGVAQAQQNQKNDRLKKLLEDRVIPPPSQDKKPPVIEKKDLHWIGPQQRSGDKKGQLAPSGEQPFGIFAGFSRQNTYHLVSNENGGLKFISSDAASWNARVQLAQAPAAKRNSFIIQLRPTATLPQINAMLAKYGLRVTSGRAEYYLLVVERPSGATGVEAEKLSDVLNQQILGQLRREPIVAGATVNTAVSRQSIPKASTTSVTQGGIAITWNWGTITPLSATAATVMASTNPQVIPTPQTDGNWGMKSIRVPTVWTILQRYRDANPNLVRPKVAILDTGFAAHDDLVMTLQASPNLSPTLAVTSATGNCGTAHGNHVAGIIGATHGNSVGVDGIIPLAKIDAVPWQDTLIGGEDPAATSEDTRTTFFDQALFALIDYVAASANSDLRVVNLSLGYNFGARPVVEGDPEKIAGLREHIETQANFFSSLAKKNENRILFVTAAGNDSTGRGMNPYDAKWSTPIAWAVTELPAARRPKNVLIVEAFDRSGQRADFSNVGGHVSAPGVDILSTLWMGDNPYGACPGTSMAAPHVTGIAGLLFELDPGKKPADIVNIIKTSAFQPIVIPGGPPRPPGAPRVDALEAALKLSPNILVRLADLNRDGKVDTEDMKIFARHLSAIDENRKSGKAFTEDLNGDGVIDANECVWPFIDLNGSGNATLSLADAKFLQGQFRSDLDVLALAWTDKNKDFKTALKETGLDIALQTAETAPMAVTSQGCR